MYSIPSYAAMIADSVRVDAYAAALERSITPDSFVIEIGTGIGVIAVMAKQMGARRVAAVETSDAIAVARLLAKDNGADIEFHQAKSQDVSFDERADIVVSDLRGVLPVHGDHFGAIVDARERLLKPNGTLIPQADTLWVAAVQRPTNHMLGMGSLSKIRGVSIEALRPFLTNAWERGRVTADQVLTSSTCWATVDYRNVRGHGVAGDARLRVTRDGTADGLLVWFETQLADGITFSNGPDSSELIYGAGFFPWSQSVDVAQGDDICVRIDANHVGGDYVWRWRSKVVGSSPDRPLKAEFSQSTFQGTPVVPAALTRGAAAHMPQLDDRGVVERFILNAMDGARSNQEIARQVALEFPQAFGRFEDALGRVGQVARRFAKQ